MGSLIIVFLFLLTSSLPSTTINAFTLSSTNVQKRTDTSSSSFHQQRNTNNAYHDGYEEEEPSREYLATCIPGLAQYLEDELYSCGATTTQVLSDSAVSFRTPTAAATTTSTSSESSSIDDSAVVPLKALLWTRTAHRLLEKIDTFYGIETRDDVYDAVQSSRMDVKDLLGDGQGGLLSLSVKVIANGRLPKDVSHSHYTALTIKNALVDQVRALRADGERPDVDLDDADVPLVAIFHSRGMTADMSLYRSLAPPGSLHRRGYRSGGAIHKAAMKESMAAGLLLAAEWDQKVRDVRQRLDIDDDDNIQEGLTLVDPMCGSGSLLIEAAMIAVDFAPGLMRIMNHVPGSQLPPVLRWKGNRESLLPIWKEMLMEASATVKEGINWMRNNNGALELIGNDIHAGALDLAEASLKKAGGLHRIVDLHQNDCREWNLLGKDERQNHQICVMTNPPWGVRLSDDDHESWESLRTFLRSNCPPGRTEAFVLSGNKSATRHLGLRRSQSVVLRTGQQDLRWIQYVLLEKRGRDEDSSDTTGIGRPTSSLRRQQQQPSYPQNVTPERRIIRTRSIGTAKTDRRQPVGGAKTKKRKVSPQSRRQQSANTKVDDSWI